MIYAINELLSNEAILILLVVFSISSCLLLNKGSNGLAKLEPFVDSDDSGEDCQDCQDCQVNSSERENESENEKENRVETEEYDGCDECNECETQNKESNRKCDYKVSSARKLNKKPQSSKKDSFKENLRGAFR